MKSETSKFQIRDARVEELDEVSEVLSAAYQQYAPSFPPQLWEDYSRDIADVRSRLGDAELIVADYDGRIAGAVTFYPDHSRPGGEGWPEGWSGIRLLAVHPHKRGLGIGRALTQECLRRSRERGIATVGLHTTEPMSVARKMYERMGFVRVPEFDFHPTRTLVVMAYQLDL